LRINGNDVTTEQAKVRKDIGIVFQECTLDSKLTVRENLKLHCDFYAVPKAEIKDRIQFVLRLVDIEEWRNAPVSALSGGLKRRAEIARGLVHFPKVLFLDEPTTGLDPQARRQLWELIERFKLAGRTILLTTHYMDEAERLCDRVAIMDRGKVIALGTPRELIASIGAEHLVEFSSARVPDAAGLAEIEGIRDVHAENGTVRMLVAELHLAVPALLNEMARQGIPLTELRTHSATLEDVFVTLTGRRLRDE
jgi:ABC-2 type transport system ATP-binding protein